MSMKDWLYSSKDGKFGLYRFVWFGGKDKPSNNPATIQLTEPKEFNIERVDSGEFSKTCLTIDIDHDQFDKMAIAWIKDRGPANEYLTSSLKEILGIDKADNKTDPCGPPAQFESPIEGSTEQQATLFFEPLADAPTNKDES